MEEQLSFVRKLSLAEMALRRVVASLWTDACISTPTEELPDREIRYSRLHEQKEKWRDLGEKVRTKVSELVIPELLKKRMMEVVMPIGLDIREWKKCMRVTKYVRDSVEYLDTLFLEQLCWTSTGAVDHKRTVERMVRLEALDVLNRFGLASLYCLEDDIPVLWGKLPDDYKRSFQDVIDVRESIERSMECYWAFVQKGEESKLDNIFKRLHNFSNLSFHQNSFVRSAVKGNKAATEYFYQKLTDNERDVGLVLAVCADLIRKNSSEIGISFYFPERSVSDILCYLLSVLSPEQQRQLFNRHSYEVLTYFLVWPWQYFFMDIAHPIWPVIPDMGYRELINCICESIGIEDYYVPNFIQNFFLRIPSDCKQSFLRQFGSHFPKFSYAEDTETIKVIFRNTDLGDRAQLVSSYWFSNLLGRLLLKDKWHLVDLCLREAALSKGNRESLMEKMSNHLLQDFRGEEVVCIANKLIRFYELFVETDASAPDKRSSDVNQ